MDEVADYLRRVSAVKRAKFRNGYANERSDKAVTNKAHCVSGGEEGTLAAAKGEASRSVGKRERDEAVSDKMVLTDRRQADFTSSPVSDAASAAAAIPLRRVSLIDKWFPGNTLKEATLELAQAPTVEFISNTVSRLTTMRERMVTLRGGVDDMEGLLASVARNASMRESDNVKATTAGEGRRWCTEQIARLVNAQSWHAFQELLLQSFSIETTSLQGTRRVVRYLLLRKPDATCPVDAPSVRRWHEFLNCRGPECAGVPSLSLFAWMTSASTTALFIVLTQRLLRGVREARATSCAKSVGQDGFAQCIADGLDRADDVLDITASESDASAAVDAGDTCDDSHGGSWLRACSRQMSDTLTDAQKELLVFLTFFMPVACDGQPSASSAAEGKTTRRVSTGFGVWLLACLCALDYPLDPDTDRLVHDLFRTCCEQVRVISEWKGVSGESRGSLVAAFAESEMQEGGRLRRYHALEDIGKEDVLALYTVIVVLAKFFRQNQNRLIPL